MACCIFLPRGYRLVHGLLLVVLCAAGSLVRQVSAFCPAPSVVSTTSPINAIGHPYFRASTSCPGRRVNSIGVRDGDGTGARESRTSRNHRTTLFESIRSNREKIDRAMSRLRDAMRSNDEELVERLKAFIMHLRKRDPQFATQDAMDEALEKGLFSTAAKLKLKLAAINQNPFRQSLLDSSMPGEDNDDSGDVSEDMSWGFDQTFFGEEGDGGDEPDDYDDI